MSTIHVNVSEVLEAEVAKLQETLMTEIQRRIRAEVLVDVLSARLLEQAQDKQEESSNVQAE